MPWRAAPSSPRECSGILPPLPLSGIGSHFSTNELVNALDAKRGDRSQGLPRSPGKGTLNRITGKVDLSAGIVKGVQNVRGVASRAFRAKDSQQSLKVLYEHHNTHLSSLGFSDFDGHDSHDEGQEATRWRAKPLGHVQSSHGEHSHSSSASTLPSVMQDESPTRQSQKSLRPLFGGAAHMQRSKCKEKLERLPRDRLHFLQASFKNKFSEIEHRANQMHLTLCLWRHSQTLHDLELMSLQGFPDAELVANTYETVQLDTTPIKSPPATAFVDDADQGSIPSHSERQELLQCTARLNFYRWLCGLGQVCLQRPCLTICEALAASLVPRDHPSKSKEGGQEELAKAKGGQEELAKVLCDVVVGDVLSTDARAIIMHGDGSLLTAVEQSLLGYDPQADDPSESPLASREKMAQELAHSVARRKEEGATRQQHRRENLRGPWSLPMDVIDAKDLPSGLKPLGLLWELQEHTKCEAPSKRRCGNMGRAKQLLVPSPNSIKPTRAGLPEIERARTRSEPPRGSHHCGSRTARSSSQSARGMKHSAFWGDQDGSLNFRRLLLNPALTTFGASRHHDTCVLWTGHLGRSPPVVPEKPCRSTCKGDAHRMKSTSHGDDAALMDMDAVCFPPTGFVPLEIINNESRVLWTVMPHSRHYQPTQKLRVRMWRARIHTPCKVIKHPRFDGISTEDAIASECREWVAERLDEVSVNELKVDCSSHGNPFCIIFRPELGKIKDGDQFEVQVSGLCGVHPELVFFHHFCAMGQHVLDDCLMQEVSRFRTVLANPLLWQEVQAYFPSEESLAHSSEQALQARRSAQGTEVPPIGMVSHPDCEIQVDTVDLTIALCCEQVEAIVPVLYLSLGSGLQEVVRAVQVSHIGAQFLLRVKFPMAPARFELHFSVVLSSAPEIVMPHPLKYTIVSSELCKNMVASLQHPLLQKFGYAPMVPTAQLHRILVLSPITYRICLGATHFLFHMPPESATHQEHDQLASVEAPMRARGTTLFSSRLQRYPQPARAGVKGRQNGAADLHEALAGPLADVCQDSIGEIHLDVSIGGRYVTRLKPRNDFPELFEAMMTFEADDVGSRVEIFLRRPRAQCDVYAPQKLGEWLICLSESFPAGF